MHASSGALQRYIKVLQAAIAKDPALDRLFAILTSIPGIGPVAATTMIAELNKLGKFSRTQIAAFLGVAPMNWDSGFLSGRRIIKVGRAPLRAVIYMAAVTAIRANPDIKTIYQRLRDNGKKPKVSLKAVMRKLVILAKILVNPNRNWKPLTT